MKSVSQIQEELRHRLVTGQFEHGAKLRAEQLRAEFGCSASTVREILFRLSAVGLVDFEEQRGFRVPPQSPERQHELTAMRILLEQEGACLSIRRGGVAWESQLSAAHHKLGHIESRIRSAGNVAAYLDLWCRAEQEFHETLISACGSALMLRIHGQTYAQFRQQLVSAATDYGYFPENVAEHQAILDAALDRDQSRVRSCIHDHLKRNLNRSE